MKFVPFCDYCYSRFFDVVEQSDMVFLMVMGDVGTPLFMVFRPMHTSNAGLVIDAVSAEVLYILLGCRCPQVIRIHAAWIVANMIYEQPFGYWPFMDFVRHSVSFFILPTLGKSAVASPAKAPRPLPARRCFVDPGQEPLTVVEPGHFSEVCIAIELESVYMHCAVTMGFSRLRAVLNGAWWEAVPVVEVAHPFAE